MDKRVTINDSTEYVVQESKMEELLSWLNANACLVENSSEKIKVDDSEIVIDIEPAQSASDEAEQKKKTKKTGRKK